MPKSIGKFEQRFIKLLKEMTVDSTLGGSEGLEGGSVGNTDSYASGDQRIPTSIFGGTLTRNGKTKCRKCKKGKKCKSCKEEEELKETK